MSAKEELDEEMSTANRLNAQRLGVTLRNLLKLPKAHKWVCFEFFYSNIDKYATCTEAEATGPYFLQKFSGSCSKEKMTSVYA